MTDLKLQQIFMLIKPVIKKMMLYESGLNGAFYQYLAQNNSADLALGTISDDGLNTFSKLFNLSWSLIETQPRFLNEKICRYLIQKTNADAAVSILLLDDKCLMTIILIDYQEQFEFGLPNEGITTKENKIIWCLVKITQIFCDFFTRKAA